MSLQSTIYKLNNDLITLFAVLDGWCDRHGGFLDQKHKTSLTAFETLQQVIVLNEYTLSLLSTERNKCVEEKEEIDLLYAKLTLAGHAFSFSLLIPDAFGEPGLDKVNRLDICKIRDLLREQLFELLCTMDKLHNCRLDFPEPQTISPAQRGIEIIRIMTDNVFQVVKIYEDRFEFSS
jgi:hypothetical protein